MNVGKLKVKVQGLSASQVAPLTQWHQDQFIGAGGDVANINAAEMEAEFRRVAKRAALPEALVNVWWRTSGSAWG